MFRKGNEAPGVRAVKGQKYQRYLGTCVLPQVIPRHFEHLAKATCARLYRGPLSGAGCLPGVRLSSITQHPQQPLRTETKVLHNAILAYETFQPNP